MFIGPAFRNLLTSLRGVVQVSHLVLVSLPIEMWIIEMMKMMMMMMVVMMMTLTMLTMLMMMMIQGSEIAHIEFNEAIAE